MEKEILEKYLLAGKIASEVREESRALIKVGSSLLEIAEKIESLIRKKGALPAFPVNLSLNEISAHHTPIPKDKTIIGDSDLIKVDIGVHVDGYVGDTAYSVSFNPEHNDLIKASESALNETIKLCTPNTKLSDISSAIEETIKSFGFKPISNLTGHGLARYDLHAEPQIPNVKFFNDYRLKEDQVLAIEPFATNGIGKVKETDKILIFRFLEKKPIRNFDARKILAFAEKMKFPIAERWLSNLNLSEFKMKIALRELRMLGLIYDYPELKEISNGIVSQSEHTIIVKDEPIVTTK